MNKRDVFNQVVDAVEQELAILKKAMQAAYDETTHADTKSEGKYDTRAIEAGYLAGAQAERARIHEEQLNILKKLFGNTVEKSFKKAEFGSIVRVRLVASLNQPKGREQVSYYLLTPFFAGLSVEDGGIAIKTITNKSQLGKLLTGVIAGDFFSLTIAGDEKEFEVESIF